MEVRGRALTWSLARGLLLLDAQVEARSLWGLCMEAWDVEAQAAKATDCPVVISPLYTSQMLGSCLELPGLRMWW